MASNPDMLFGDYAAFVNPNFTKTPYQGLKSLAPVASLANGCTDPRCQDYNQTAIRTAVTGADLVVVCVGLGNFNFNTVEQCAGYFSVFFLLDSYQ